MLLINRVLFVNVIGDIVENNIHFVRVGVVEKLLKYSFIAKTKIDLGGRNGPISMVSRKTASHTTLVPQTVCAQRVLGNRRKPNRIHSQIFDISIGDFGIYTL